MDWSDYIQATEKDVSYKASELDTGMEENSLTYFDLFGDR